MSFSPLDPELEMHLYSREMLNTERRQPANEEGLECLIKLLPEAITRPRRSAGCEGSRFPSSSSW